MALRSAVGLGILGTILLTAFGFLREEYATARGRLTAAIVGRTLVMMTESFRLQDISREEVAAAQRSALTTVTAFSAALVILVAASMFFAFRSIAQPLARRGENGATRGNHTGGGKADFVGLPLTPANDVVAHRDRGFAVKGQRIRLDGARVGNRHRARRGIAF